MREGSARHEQNLNNQGYEKEITIAMVMDPNSLQLNSSLRKNIQEGLKNYENAFGLDREDRLSSTESKQKTLTKHEIDSRCEQLGL